MRKEQIEKMIDKKIEAKFSDGNNNLDLIKVDLAVMSKNISRVLEREGVNFKDLENLNWEDIEKSRIKYATHYVKHCRKRIIDMEWIYSKSNKLKLTELKTWKLLLFRETLLNSKVETTITEAFKKQLDTAKPLTLGDFQNWEIFGFGKDFFYWTNGEPKEIGETPLKAFVKDPHGRFDLHQIPLHNIDLYDLDLDYYDKIRINPKDVLNPYLIKSEEKKNKIKIDTNLDLKNRSAQRKMIYYEYINKDYKPDIIKTIITSLENSDDENALYKRSFLAKKSLDSSHIHNPHTKELESFCIRRPYDYKTNPLWNEFLVWLNDIREKNDQSPLNGDVECFYGISKLGFSTYAYIDTIFDQTVPLEYFLRIKKGEK